jgi:hypothetical protein
MFFRKKSKKEIKCINCHNSFSKKYNFCPFCGNSMINAREEAEKFGMLGRKDLAEEELVGSQLSPFGPLGSIFTSMVGGLMRNLFNEIQKGEVTTFPNGINIKIGGYPRKQQKEKKLVRRTISEEQLKRMSALPRVEAKTSMKRVGGKIIYEISMPGISSPEDIFVSKLESGYEIKAICSDKVYVNSLPVNLPIKSFAMNENTLFVEFITQEE